MNGAFTGSLEAGGAEATERLASVKQFYGRMEKLDAMFQELERAQKEYEQAAAVHGRVQEDLGIMEQLFMTPRQGFWPEI